MSIYLAKYHIYLKMKITHLKSKMIRIETMKNPNIKSRQEGMVYYWSYGDLKRKWSELDRLEIAIRKLIQEWGMVNGERRRVTGLLQNMRGRMTLG